MTSGAIQYGVPVNVSRLLQVLASCALTPKSTVFLGQFAIHSFVRCAIHLLVRSFLAIGVEMKTTQTEFDVSLDSEKNVASFDIAVNLFVFVKVCKSL